MLSYLNKMDRRHLVLLQWSSVLILLAGLMSYGIWPQYKAYQKIFYSTKVLVNVKNSDLELKQELVRLQEDVGREQQDLHGDMANLSEQQIESFVIGNLQDLSWRHDIQLMSVRPGLGQSVAKFKEALFDLEISGTYLDLFSWLNDLGKELGFIVVQKFAMQPLSNKEEEQQLKMKLTIIAYRVEQP